ncbi:MAG: hypothetical protein ABI824_01765 [Acidobacteriota bacterium]
MNSTTLYRLRSIAVTVLIPLAILAGTTTQLLNREIGGFSALVAAQCAIAGAILLSFVLPKAGDRETLSVYNEIRGYK